MGWTQIGQGMNINDVFPSKYLKADDLRGNRVAVTISHVEVEDVSGEGEQKPVLYFQNKQKGLVLNRTNANALITITGSAETTKWENRSVYLVGEPVTYKGQATVGIRIKPLNGRTRALPESEPDTRPQMGHAVPDGGDLTADDIPF